MGKLSKKLGRKKQLDAKKEAEDNLVRQVGMFGLRPDNCSICSKPFATNSREMAMTWRVIVSEEKKKVTLICPECQEKIDEGMKKVFGGNDDEAGV
jgi:DNA-directed RNA polymerase subunit RPC12/RpoP